MQGYNGLPRPPPGDLLDPGIKPVSLTSPAKAGGFFTTTTTWETQSNMELGGKREEKCSITDSWQTQEEAVELDLKAGAFLKNFF